MEHFCSVRIRQQHSEQLSARSVSISGDASNAIVATGTGLALLDLRHRTCSRVVFIMQIKEGLWRCAPSETTAVASSSGRCALIWNVELAKIVTTLAGDSIVDDIAWSPVSPSILATASPDAVRFWDLRAPGTPVRLVEGAASGLAWSNSGILAAFSGCTAKAVDVRTGASGAHAASFECPIRNIDASPSTKSEYLVCGDEGAWIWDGVTPQVPLDVCGGANIPALGLFLSSTRDIVGLSNDFELGMWRYEDPAWKRDDSFAPTLGPMTGIALPAALDSGRCCVTWSRGGHVHVWHHGEVGNDQDDSIGDDDIEMYGDGGTDFLGDSILGNSSCLDSKTISWLSLVRARCLGSGSSRR